MYYVVLNELGDLWNKKYCKLYAFDTKKKCNIFWAEHLYKDEDGIYYTHIMGEKSVKNIFGEDYEKYICNK